MEFSTLRLYELLLGVSWEPFLSSRDFQMCWLVVSFLHVNTSNNRTTPFFSSLPEAGNDSLLLRTSLIRLSPLGECRIIFLSPGPSRYLYLQSPFGHTQNTAAGSMDEGVATVQGTDILPATSRGQGFLSMILNVFNMMVIIFILCCSYYDPAIANQAQCFVFFCLFVWSDLILLTSNLILFHTQP